MQGDQHRQHISEQFNAELEAMKNHLLEMGGLVEQQLTLALGALINRDSGDAQLVIDRDREVDQLEMQVDDECSRILARRQPAASDLRLVLAVARSTTDLERIGDEAVKIARQGIKLSELESFGGGIGEFRQLGQHVSQMLRHSLDSFARLDTNRAFDVVVDDGNVDDEYDLATESLVAEVQRDNTQVRAAFHLMWALKGLERIGDHATNIAEQVIYLVSGRDVRHTSKIELRSLMKIDTGVTPS
ncbi:MAG: phosphate signaling complex protein PhoU [Pseudomonadota bacterium]